MLCERWNQAGIILFSCKLFYISKSDDLGGIRRRDHLYCNPISPGPFLNWSRVRVDVISRADWLLQLQRLQSLVITNDSIHSGHDGRLKDLGKVLKRPDLDGGSCLDSEDVGEVPFVDDLSSFEASAPELAAKEGEAPVVLSLVTGEEHSLHPHFLPELGIGQREENSTGVTVNKSKLIS